MGDMGETMKSESLRGRKEEVIKVKNVCFKVFAKKFKTKDRFEHFSLVLISEVKGILAIKIEKM